MVPITFKIAEEELAELDRFIAEGSAGNRTEALREALRSWLRAQRDSEIAAAYRRGYGKHPQEAWVGEDGIALLEEWSTVQEDDPESLFP